MDKKWGEGNPLLVSHSPMSSSSPLVKRLKPSPSDGVTVHSPESNRKTSSSSSWTEEDEIRLLNAVVEIARKRSDSSGESDSLFDRIESSLRGNYSWEQMIDKLKQLKTKYENREVEILIENSHLRDMFEICEKIWGDESGGSGGSELNGGSETGGMRAGKLGLGFNFGRVFGVGEILRKGLECLEESKVKELNDQWRLQEMREIELLNNRVELVRELTQLIFEAIESSKLN